MKKRGAISPIKRIERREAAMEKRISWILALVVTILVVLIILFLQVYNQEVPLTGKQGLDDGSDGNSVTQGGGGAAAGVASKPGSNAGRQPSAPSGSQQDQGELAVEESQAELTFSQQEASELTSISSSEEISETVDEIEESYQRTLENKKRLEILIERTPYGSDRLKEELAEIDLAITEIKEILEDTANLERAKESEKIRSINNFRGTVKNERSLANSQTPVEEITIIGDVEVNYKQGQAITSAEERFVDWTIEIEVNGNVPTFDVDVRHKNIENLEVVSNPSNSRIEAVYSDNIITRAINALANRKSSVEINFANGASDGTYVVMYRTRAPELEEFEVENNGDMKFVVDSEVNGEDINYKQVVLKLELSELSPKVTESYEVTSDSGERWEHKVTSENGKDYLEILIPHTSKQGGTVKVIADALEIDSSKQQIIRNVQKEVFQHDDVKAFIPDENLARVKFQEKINKMIIYAKFIGFDTAGGRKAVVYLKDSQTKVGEGGIKNDEETVIPLSIPENQGGLEFDIDFSGGGIDIDQIGGGGESNTQCSDGADNDNDGLIDLGDPGCESSNDNDETEQITNCGDGIDNDQDGWIDYPADPGCANELDLDESNGNTGFACSNNADDDGDGLTDANDPACHSWADPSEIAECQNNLDDDGDTWIDMNDPDCTNMNDNENEFNAPPECSDGQDNEASGDGLVDEIDPACWEDPNDPDSQYMPLYDDESLATSQCQDGNDNDGDGNIDYPMDRQCIDELDYLETGQNRIGGEDSDGDGILDDGDNSGIPGDNYCRGGDTTNCDDNCVYISNSNQADSDNDGVGDVCEPRDPPTNGDGTIGGGGGAGGGFGNAGQRIEGATTYRVSSGSEGKFTIDSFFEGAFRENDLITFKAEEEHTIKVNDINGQVKTITITVSSTPVTKTLSEEGIETFDLGENEPNFLVVKADNVQSGVAFVTIMLMPKSQVPEKGAEEYIEGRLNTITSRPQNMANVLTSPQTEFSKRTIGIVLLILIAIAIIIYFVARSRGNRLR